MPTRPAFSVERDGRIAVVLFDLPGRPVNLLTVEIGTALGDTLDALAADADVDAVVLTSGKPDGFIAGADIDAFVALTSEDEARDLSRDGQRMVDRVEAFAKPLVVAIHGACLGGGLELALAASYRIATDDASTRLGLPEVQLGLIPGAGGCQRLPRLVGLRAALDAILTGRRLRPSQARRIGLVDEVVPVPLLRHLAVAAARRLANGHRVADRRPRGLLGWLLDGNPAGRWLVCWQAERQARAKTGGHYPAPFAAIDVVQHGLSQGIAAGLVREAEWFGRLAAGPVSRHLVQIFLATTALKKDPGVDTSVAIPRVDRLGVVGAGFMGAGIAGLAALKAGVDVRLRDTDWPRVARGLGVARSTLDEAKTRRRLDRYDHARRVSLLSGSPDDAGFTNRHLVIEAVFEDLDVKRDVLASLERIVSRDCVIASNTSTLQIADLQRGAARPERIVGMHFFSPVDRMPLLEVIRGPKTSAPTALLAVRFGQRLGKTVIVVRDAPGFWVNRILAPYLNEAGWLLDEGASIAAIDRALTRAGFPVGPMALLDEVGLDVAGKASAVLHAAFGDRLTPAPAVARLLEDGRLGRKSGGGFYTYAGGKRKGVSADAAAFIRPSRPGDAPADDDLARRPVLMMLNEAARALSESVVQSPRDGDLGAIMGFGFPPFLGGPFRHIDHLGAGAVVTDLERHAARHGPRFAPADLLVDMARHGRSFHP